jgi:hypothetical protein
VFAPGSNQKSPLNFPSTNSIQPVWDIPHAWKVLERFLKGTTIAFFMKYPDFVRSVINGSPSLKQENPFPKKY